MQEDQARASRAAAVRGHFIAGRPAGRGLSQQSPFFPGQVSQVAGTSSSTPFTMWAHVPDTYGTAPPSPRPPLVEPTDWPSGFSNPRNWIPTIKPAQADEYQSGQICRPNPPTGYRGRCPPFQTMLPHTSSETEAAAALRNMASNNHHAPPPQYFDPAQQNQHHQHHQPQHQYHQQPHQYHQPQQQQQHHRGLHPDFSTPTADAGPMLYGAVEDYSDPWAQSFQNDEDISISPEVLAHYKEFHQPNAHHQLCVDPCVLSNLDHPLDLPMCPSTLPSHPPFPASQQQIPYPIGTGTTTAALSPSTCNATIHTAVELVDLANHTWHLGPSPAASSSVDSVEEPKDLPEQLDHQDHQDHQEQKEHKCGWITGPRTETCGLVFLSCEELQEHARKEHVEKLVKSEHGFVCNWEKCPRLGNRRRRGGIGFAQRSKLERHLQSHTDYKPAECPICKLQLSSQQALSCHMNTHTGYSPHVCQYCGLSFKQPSAKTMHERVHTGEKPLQCEVCGMRFGESSNLSKHRKTHNIRGEHICTLCNKDFTRLDQLERHMKTVHDPSNPKNTTTSQRTKRGKKEAAGRGTIPTPTPSDSEDSIRRASISDIAQSF